MWFENKKELLQDLYLPQERSWAAFAPCKATPHFYREGSLQWWDENGHSHPAVQQEHCRAQLCWARKCSATDGQHSWEQPRVTAAHCSSGQPSDIPTAAQVGHNHLRKGTAVKWKYEIERYPSVTFKYPIDCMTCWIYMRRWHRSCHTDQKTTMGQRNHHQGSAKCQMEVPSKSLQKLSQASRKITKRQQRFP